MNDAASATALIDELHRLLPGSMPAHEVLGMRADRAAESGMPGADYVYVQGRGDRLHAFGDHRSCRPCNRAVSGQPSARHGPTLICLQSRWLDW